MHRVQVEQAFERICQRRGQTKALEPQARSAAVGRRARVISAARMKGQMNFGLLVHERTAAVLQEVILSLLMRRSLVAPPGAREVEVDMVGSIRGACRHQCSLPLHDRPLPGLQKLSGQDCPGAQAIKFYR